MPRDQQKYQKALMKKRSKQKAAAKTHAARRASSSLSLQTILRNAHIYPLLECLITPNWEKNELGLIQILVPRQQPDGNICFGFYLIDNYCLGLKNTLGKVNIAPEVYRTDVLPTLYRGEVPEKCSPELAHQMIYQAIDYAAQFGFEPERDFVLTQNVLVPQGELAEPYQLTFGKNGKPFFISGPHDNVGRILRQLDKTAGPGNYDFLAMAPPF